MRVLDQDPEDEQNDEEDAASADQHQGGKAIVRDAATAAACQKLSNTPKEAPRRSTTSLPSRGPHWDRAEPERWCTVFSINTHATEETVPGSKDYRVIVSGKNKVRRARPGLHTHAADFGYLI